jgi:hypothetical protein
MSALFSCSAWIVVCWGIVIIFSLVLWGQETKSFHTDNPVGVVLGGAFLVVSIIAFLAIIFGMAIFCACEDRRSIGTKALLIIIFFLTAPFGPTAYFFSVYRRQRATPLEAAHG